MPDNSTSSAPAAGDPVGVRILDHARKHILSQGFSRLKMDDLASQLGISKKTLYVHFPGKNAIVGAIMDGIARMVRARLEAIVNNPKLSTAEKTCAVVDTVGDTMSRLGPGLLRELKQEAPELYRRMEEIRSRNIPVIFGRLLQLGIAEGSVRADVDPEFVCEFWLQSIRGLLDPETLERTQLTPKQTIAKAAALMFNGVFTPSGQRAFDENVRPHLDSLANPAPL